MDLNNSKIEAARSLPLGAPAHLMVHAAPSPRPQASNPVFNIAPYIRQGLSTDDIVINWLKETLEDSPDETLCREVLFHEYTKFVREYLGTSPMNSASLGKLLVRLLNLDFSMENCELI